MTKSRAHPKPVRHHRRAQGHRAPARGGARRARASPRVVDLLLHLPMRYEDRSQRVALAGPLAEDARVLVWGRVTVGSARHTRRRGLRIVTGVVDDGTGTLPVVWFNQPWIDRRPPGRPPAVPLRLFAPRPTRRARARQPGGQRHRGRRRRAHRAGLPAARSAGRPPAAPADRAGAAGVDQCPDPIPAELCGELACRSWPPRCAASTTRSRRPESRERAALVGALCRREHRCPPPSRVRRAAGLRLRARRAPLAAGGPRGAPLSGAAADRRAGAGDVPVRADWRPAAGDPGDRRSTSAGRIRWRGWSRATSAAARRRSRRSPCGWSSTAATRRH